ncbi:methyltransferase domain-containing protein [Roseibacterium sp. SDUM158017]|uniref:class I SAM-dependent DNA methyltransferase n=1 Tax=Roseicyclus salinarum TaxID=3036773 RepID=UPI002414E88F|nr:methyltransferase [Roseibacterium sp. SDUM158017]MDG4650345.1 methyltransferase domain-containing protein [Roseibacterium sp. SDUM158017]
MTGTYLDGVYDLDGEDDVRAYYDAWAGTYDAELAQSGYATPSRCAEALAATGLAPEARLLDMGCGTGLSGAAFADAGFTTIDGCDLSQGMLTVARERGVYRGLHLPEDLPPHLYDAVAAVGVIGAGAGPPDLLDTCLAHLRPGGLMVFSFNDHTLGLPEFPARLAAVTEAGTARIRSSEDGPHLPSLDINSTVYVLEKAS